MTRRSEGPQLPQPPEPPNLEDPATPPQHPGRAAEQPEPEDPAAERSCADSPDGARRGPVTGPAGRRGGPGAHDGLGLRLRSTSRRLAALAVRSSLQRPGALSVAVRERALTEAAMAFAPGQARFDAEVRELSAREAAARAIAEARLDQVIYLGAARRPLFSSFLGWTWPDGDPLALSRAGGQVILSAGAQGAGKSQALLSIIETALAPRPPLTSETLPPTAVLAFHCDLSGATLPELLHAAWPTQSAADRDYLARHLGVAPRGLGKIRLLVPAESLEDVYARVRAAVGELPPNLELRPLRLRPHHLGARGLAALFGVDPRHPPRYLRELLAQALALGPALTTAALHTAILGCEALSRGQQARALARLALLQEIESTEDDNDDHDGDPWALCEPGVLSVVHLTGRWLSADHALPLIVALMNVFVQQSPRHGPLQRMIVLDEINELRGTPELWAALVVTARQIRHLGSVLWLSGQDLCNVPTELLGLSTIVLCFRLRSPRVFAHLQRSVAGFGRVRFARVAALEPGHAIVVATECSRPELRGRPLTIYVRPPSCAHGGHTRAVN